MAKLLYGAMKEKKEEEKNSPRMTLLFWGTSQQCVSDWKKINILIVFTQNRLLFGNVPEKMQEGLKK